MVLHRCRARTLAHIPYDFPGRGPMVTPPGCGEARSTPSCRWSARFPSAESSGPTTSRRLRYTRSGKLMSRSLSPSRRAGSVAISFRSIAWLMVFSDSPVTYPASRGETA